ncbi:MAG: hypothetical protein IKU24_02405, partial [Clostridia bacterium]|nr:hypothetical protein [Clostridia bacterium]
MKKTISIILAAVIIVTLSLPAFAASGIDQYEQKILEKLESVSIVTSKGWKFYFSQENINGARNYFISNEVGEVDEDTMNVILTCIDDAVALIKEEA